MAEEKHDEIPRMLLSLQDNENSSTLLPTLGIRANDNFDQCSNPKPDVNLQLSLGGFYDKAPNSAPISPTSFNNPTNSMMKRSCFEKKKFLQKEVAEIKINQVITKPRNQEGGSAGTFENEKSNEVNTLVSPLSIPIWAGQSAFANPAFQRAINVIKSNGIPSTPISTNLRGYTSRNPHAVGGFGSQLPILYHQFNNGKPIGTHFNNGTNQRFFVLQKQQENLNLVAPVDFASGSRNFVPNQQSQTLKLLPHFNCSLATMDRPSHWSKDGNLMMHSVQSLFTPSFPFPIPFGTRGHNISIMPQNAIGHSKPHIPSNFFPNAKAPLFLPISNSTNTNVNPFIPHQPSQPFTRPGVRTIPLPEVLNGSRVHHNLMNPLDYPCKRARRDNCDAGEVELQLMKQLPTVVTTGGNPNGKKIEGLLYKYGSDREVTIICVCHGCFFTPEEFVRHAGSGDVENPTQQISVLDHPDYFMK